MCLCLRNTTGARASAFLGSFPPRTHDFFLLPFLFLPFLFSSVYLSFLLFFLSFPVFFFFRPPPVFLCSHGVRRANHSCQWSLSHAHSLRSRILHVGVVLVGPTIIIEHLSDPVPSLGSPPLLRRVFCLFFREVFDEKPRQVKLLMVSQRSKRKREIPHVSCILSDSPHSGFQRRILANALKYKNN